MAVSSTLTTYRQEVFNFLRTVTIKYSPWEEANNLQVVARSGTVDSGQPATWKYYQNMAGEYYQPGWPGQDAPYVDTWMTIVSLDTHAEVVFTKAMLADHPKTRAAYRPGQPEYAALVGRYPHQVDLIKSIVYPVLDLDAAVQADDFTLLAWGDGFLEPTEQESIIRELVVTLRWIQRRWHFTFLAYEEYFHTIFWGQLWTFLVDAIFLARLKNLHTPAAHSFHVWEFLGSHGLADYRDILSAEQTAFLYRNIRYLHAIRGSQRALTILADNLLREAGVALVGRTIYQQTLPADDCRWTPTFVAEPVPSVYASALRDPGAEDMTAITMRLAQVGLENDVSPAHIANQERLVGATTRNTLPTKLIELQPVVVDTQYADFMTVFVADMLMRCTQDGRYTRPITLTHPLTRAVVTLEAPQALAYAYYCAWRALDQTPTHLPTRYTPRFTFRPVVHADDLPETLLTDVGPMPTSAFYDRAAVVAGLVQPVLPITDADEFSRLVGRLFAVAVRITVLGRSTASWMVKRAIRQAFEAITDRRAYPITLDAIGDYATWLADPAHDMRPLLAVFDGDADPAQRYAEQADAILAQLVPLDASPEMRRFAGILRPKSYYTRLRQLFVQMCSYDLAVLDSEHIGDHTVFVPPITTDPAQTVATLDWERPSMAVSPDLAPGAAVSIAAEVSAVGMDADIVASHRLAVALPAVDEVHPETATVVSVTLPMARTDAQIITITFPTLGLGSRVTITDPTQP